MIQMGLYDTMYFLREGSQLQTEDYYLYVFTQEDKAT